MFARVPFPRIEWRPGVPLERKKSAPGQNVTLLEFGAGFADPNWCSHGHVAYVIDGAIEIEFEAGEGECFRAGEAFVIDAGTRHRARNPGTRAVKLFIVTTPAGTGATRNR